MYAQIEKSKENKSRAVANSVAQKKSNLKQGFGFVDNRSEVIAQRKFQNVANHTSQETIQKMSKSVIQLAEPEDSSNVIRIYFPDTYRFYGKALIEQVCTEKGLRVHAHGSGKSGDGINAATQNEMDQLLPHLQAAKQAAPKVPDPKKKKVVDKSKRHNPVEAAASAAKKALDKKDKKAEKHAKWLAGQQ